MALQRFPIEQMETFGEGLDHPEGICLGPDGTLYVGGEAGQLYRIEPDGSPTELLRTGGFMLGLASDADGRIYAADSGHRCVWRIDPATGSQDVFTSGAPDRRLRLPNWGAFAADGTYYLSDSGGWGDRDGLLWRVPPGGAAEVWTDAVRNFPNGLAVTGDSRAVYVLESYPSALVRLSVDESGCAGVPEVLCEMGAAVPDGVALAADGSLLISCYRPDAIYRWDPAEGLAIFAEDPRGTILSAPTNVAFVGERYDEIVVPNLGRWHLTRIRAGLSGLPLHMPSLG